MEGMADSVIAAGKIRVVDTDDLYLELSGSGSWGLGWGSGGLFVCLCVCLCLHVCAYTMCLGVIYVRMILINVCFQEYWRDWRGYQKFAEIVFGSDDSKVGLHNCSLLLRANMCSWD